MVDFLDDHPDPRLTKLYEDLSDKIAEVYMTQTSSEKQVWKLFFDGALKTSLRENIVAGVGVVLVSPQNYVISRTLLLTASCSNNFTEYNALLI